MAGELLILMETKRTVSPLLSKFRREADRIKAMTMSSTLSTIVLRATLWMMICTA
jgi:hypothetical protein